MNEDEKGYMSCFGRKNKINEINCQLCRRIDDEVYDKCVAKTELKHELDKVVYSCKYKDYRSDGWEGYIGCKLKFVCKPDKDCLNPELLDRKIQRKERKEKLHKIILK